MESFFALIAVVIQYFVVGLLSIGWQEWYVHPEGKLWDILVVEFFWHHPIYLDIVIS